MSRGGARISSGKDSKQDYQTPADFMEAVIERFGPITLDLAAKAENKQSPNYLAPCTGPEGPLPFDREAVAIDSFDQDWAHLLTNRFRRDGFIGLGWVNCEFNDIARWSTKCRDESKRGASELLLTPAGVGTVWFSELISPHADVYLLQPRLMFIPGQTYNKDCMLSHFVLPERRPSGKFAVKDLPPDATGERFIEIWNWKKRQTLQRWSRKV